MNFIKSNISDSRNNLSVCLLLIITTLVVYWPPQGIDFINYDDIEYVTNNVAVKTGLTLENIKWAFTAVVQDHWHPVTWLSHMLDSELFGIDAKYHHLTSLVFHTLNTLLLFLVFSKMTGTVWRSALIAFLFAVHPLHVESVMWVSERKDVLSTFFWTLTLWAYLSYIEKSNYKFYFMALVFFALGLLAKPMVVTLPCLLILLDFWPLKRHREELQLGSMVPKKFGNVKSSKTAARSLVLFVEKMPFFIMSLAISAVLFITHKDRAFHESYPFLPLKTRIADAFIFYLEYIGKAIWPQNLAISYPPLNTIASGEVVWAAIFLLMVTIIAATQIKRYPYLIVGWLWFLGTLVPVIGLVATGPHYLADRYMYIPIIGLFIMIVWGAYDLSCKWRHRNIILAAILIPLLATLSLISWQQARLYKNSITLFTHTLKVTRNNERAHMNLGAALASRGQHNQALYHFSEALRINPKSEEHHANIANSLMHGRRFEEARDHFKAAIRINPDNSNFFVNLGITYAQQKKLNKAIPPFVKAVEINPNNSKAHYNLGITYALLGRKNLARVHLTAALEIDPGYERAHRLLGELNKPSSQAVASP